MMMFSNLPTNLLRTRDYSLAYTRGLVASVLLEHGSSPAGQARLSQRDIALLAGLDWEAVHTTLKSLMDIGAIKIDRHRLVLNRNVLHEVLESWEPEEPALTK